MKSLVPHLPYLSRIQSRGMIFHDKNCPHPVRSNIFSFPVLAWLKKVTSILLINLFEIVRKMSWMRVSKAFVTLLRHYKMMWQKFRLISLPVNILQESGSKSVKVRALPMGHYISHEVWIRFGLGKFKFS